MGPGITVLNQTAQKHIDLLKSQVFRKYKNKQRYIVSKRRVPGGRKYVGKLRKLLKKKRVPKVKKTVRKRTYPKNKK